MPGWNWNKKNRFLNKIKIEFKKKFRILNKKWNAYPSLTTYFIFPLRTPGPSSKFLTWYFHVADEGFHTGQVAATTKGRETCWSRWAAYVAPMEVDPFLEDTPFTNRVLLLTGFAGRVRTGYYGQGKQIQAGSVSSAITAVGQMIALAMNTNLPIPQIVGSDKLLPRLQQMPDGFKKADPPTTKQLPVEADVPKFLVQLGLSLEARELDCAIGNLTMTHSTTCYALASTPPKELTIIQSRQRNSKWETSPSLPCHVFPIAEWSFRVWGERGADDKPEDVDIVM